jgi:DNA-binding FadR family transcriptional regulator
MNDENLATLKTMIGSMKDPGKSSESMADMDYDLHSFLIDHAGNSVMHIFFTSMRPMYQFYLKVFYSVPENAEGILPYYERFYKAAELRDDRIAAFVMGELLDFAERGMFRLLELLPDKNHADKKK